jgi:hypothetical protein
MNALENTGKHCQTNYRSTQPYIYQLPHCLHTETLNGRPYPLCTLTPFYLQNVKSITYNKKFWKELIPLLSLHKSFI